MAFVAFSLHFYLLELSLSSGLHCGKIYMLRNDHNLQNVIGFKMDRLQMPPSRNVNNSSSTRQIQLTEEGLGSSAESLVHWPNPVEVLVNTGFSASFKRGSCGGFRA